MKPKSIDLSNKCGSCDHFDPIDGTCSGYCLRNKYGENVVHDPEHPYWQVQRSRVKCADYNKKLPTNADHIRSMTDEELAVALKIIVKNDVCLNTQNEDCGVCVFHPFCNSVRCEEDVVEWLKQPHKEN